MIVAYTDSKDGYYEVDLPSGSILPDWTKGLIQCTPKTPTLVQVQTTQIALMEAAYLATITAPITYLGAVFQADKESQLLLDQAIGEYTRQGAVPIGFWWKDAANNHVPMTLLQLQGLGTAIGNRIWPAFQQLDSRKAAIRAATTVAQVQGIIW